MGHITLKYWVLKKNSSGLSPLLCHVACTSYE